MSMSEGVEKQPVACTVEDGAEDVIAVADPIATCVLSPSRQAAAAAVPGDEDTVPAAAAESASKTNSMTALDDVQNQRESKKDHAVAEDGATGAAGAATGAPVVEACDDPLAEEDAKVQSRGDGTTYTPSNRLTLSQMNQIDADDESMAKYKAQLLGPPAVPHDPDNPAPCILDKLTITFPEQKEQRPIAYPLLTAMIQSKGSASTQAEQKKIAAAEADKAKLPNNITIKQGAILLLSLRFWVQHDVVLGLRYIQSVYKRGVCVETLTKVIGSFPPKTEAYHETFHEGVAPTGWLARGDYTVKAKIMDTDGNQYCKLKYTFTIAKDWSG